MDSQRFDEIIRQLGTMRFTRSRAVRGLAGGAIATLASGLLGADARNKKRRRKNRARAQGAAGKVTICHFTSSETNPYQIITVSGNSLKAHKKHGDFAFNAEHGCCVDSDCGNAPNYCNIEAEDGAQCACLKTPKAEACKGNCGKTEVPDGCGGVWDCTCCSPQVCASADGPCVVKCGSQDCNPDAEKCCTNGGSPICIPYDRCCTSGKLDVCLPNTNAENQAGNLPHVNFVDSTNNSVTLEFVNATNSLAFFEYRIDGARLMCGTPHPVVTGDFIYPGVCVDGRANPVCATGPVVKEFSADTMVEVRLALGGERDWDFESNPSGWITFNAGS